jgi:hypothetical protein
LRRTGKGGATEAALGFIVAGRGVVSGEG